MTELHELDLQRLLEHAHIGVVIHRWDTSIVYANPTALRLLRLSHDQIIGKDVFDPTWNLVDDSCKKILIDDYPVNKVIRTRERIEDEIIGVVDSSNEDVSWFKISAYYEGEAGHANSFVIVAFNDISEDKKLFSFQDIVEKTQDIVIVTEANNVDAPTGPKIVYVNKAFEELTGYRAEEVLGETPRILQGALTDGETKARIHQALRDQQPITETLLNYNREGRPYWIEMNVIPLKNKYGELTHFAAIERDISERKFHLEQLESRNKDLRLLKRDLEKMVADRTLDLQKAKTQLEKIAFYDPLTNIPNRRHFIDHSERLIKSCDRRGLIVVVGIIDIDDFKKMNDNYGHDKGDQMLKSLSGFLNRFFRADDAFCRYGGEEFAFCVAIEKEEDAQALASRLIEGIRSLAVSLDSKKTLHISVSIGIKVCKADSKTDLDSELKAADQLLYQAKHDGKGRFVIA